MIRRGDAVRELAAAPVDGLLDLEFAGTDGVTRTLGPYLDESFTDALVVLHDGAVAFEWLRPGVAADETHIVMSISKSITALLAGALEGAGLLDTEAAVAATCPSRWARRSATRPCGTCST